jgi:hypothetical protein
MRNRLALIVLFLLTCCCIGSSEEPKTADPWAPFNFLTGKWTANGGGDPGQGTGALSFEFDLDKHVLVRKNHVSYPPTKDRPAFSHDDLLITYKESQGFRADYWDSEGHAIHYAASVSADANTIQYVSAPAAGQPAFRMSYIKAGADEIKIRFEIAPPDKPGEFKVYVEGTAKKQPTHPVEQIAPQATSQEGPLAESIDWKI